MKPQTKDQRERKDAGVTPARAALGLRAHSGWAALVGVAERGNSIEIILRQRVDLVDTKGGGHAQPYHAAEGLDLKEATRLVGASITGSRRLAQAALRRIIKEMESNHLTVAGCTVLTGSGRTLPALDRILAAHPLIHTAEGELFRAALIYAAESCGLPVTQVKEREIYERATADLRIPDEKLRLRISELGRSVGPPWREDQKLAMLGAWLALKTAH
jgi:hypothetical protein